MADFSSAAPTTGATPSTPLKYQEWVIFVSDPNQKTASYASMFKSTLPEFVGTRRIPNDDEAKKNEPYPIGMIRLFGDPGSDPERMDVLLELKGGTVMSHWPRAQSRSNRLLWENYVPKKDQPSLEALQSGHWFEKARAVDSLYVTRESKAERFFMYDVELAYPSPVQVRAGSAALGYKVGNTGSGAIHDVMLYKPSNEGWRSGEIATIASSTTKPSTGPTTSTTSPTTSASVSTLQRTVTTTERRTEAGALISKVTTSRPTSGPSSTAGPTTSASTKPADIKGIDVALSSAPVENAADLLAPWRDKLSAAGLSPVDFDLILTILEKHALDPKRLTIVYRLDPAEMDRLMPLEVVPQPTNIVRVGLVIVKNIDPAISDEVDQLITQLGDQDWNKREDAQKQLQTLGVAAKPKLEAALRNKDLEIVYRAERLLEALKKGPTQGG